MDLPPKYWGCPAEFPSNPFYNLFSTLVVIPSYLSIPWLDCLSPHLCWLNNYRILWYTPMISYACWLPRLSWREKFQETQAFHGKQMVETCKNYGFPLDYPWNPVQCCMVYQGFPTLKAMFSRTSCRSVPGAKSSDRSLPALRKPMAFLKPLLPWEKFLCFFPLNHVWSTKRYDINRYKMTQMSLFG